jgi:hypothetical protein
MSAAKRNFCRPLASRELGQERARVAVLLHRVGTQRPLSFREIRQVMNLTGPDVARRLVARGARMVREELLK